MTDAEHKATVTDFREKAAEAERKAVELTETLRTLNELLAEREELERAR